MELFAPNKEELEEMISILEHQMENAESLAEWQELNYQLKDLQTKLKDFGLEVKE